jgi:hypothetical protein
MRAVKTGVAIACICAGTLSPAWLPSALAMQARDVCWNARRKFSEHCARHTKACT